MGLWRKMGLKEIWKPTLPPSHEAEVRGYARRGEQSDKAPWIPVYSNGVGAANVVYIHPPPPQPTPGGGGGETLS